MPGLIEKNENNLLNWGEKGRLNMSQPRGAIYGARVLMGLALRKTQQGPKCFSLAPDESGALWSEWGIFSTNILASALETKLHYSEKISRDLHCSRGARRLAFIAGEESYSRPRPLFSNGSSSAITSWPFVFKSPEISFKSFV